MDALQAQPATPDYISIVIPAGIALVAGLVGYFLRYLLDKRKELNSENVKKKREMYQDFVNTLLNLLISPESEKAKRGNELMKKIRDFYKPYVLYSSPKVVKAFGTFMHYAYTYGENMDSKVMMGKLGNVIRAMRKELGLSNRGLGRNGEEVFRAMFKDFDALK